MFNPAISKARAVVVLRRTTAALALSLPLLAVPSLEAGVWQARSALVDLSVEVEGGAAPLYPARDGSGRFYVEARSGCAYVVRIANHSAQRVGILLAVDGLNAISGEREPEPAVGTRPGRMYVVDPWGEVAVRGWRTSLDDVRRFVFIDERASYAARSGRANGKMGWIEAWVYRERALVRVSPPRPDPWDRLSPTERSGEDSDRREGAAAPKDAAPGENAAAPAARADGEALRKAPEAPGTFPGTGWGGAESDPVSVVRFAAELRPSDRVTLRYEYAPALRALGVLTPPADGDRLRERERGEGFARPPAR
jgi:hypothetical protein